MRINQVFTVGQAAQNFFRGAVNTSLESFRLDKLDIKGVSENDEETGFFYDDKKSIFLSIGAGEEFFVAIQSVCQANLVTSDQAGNINSRIWMKPTYDNDEVNCKALRERSATLQARDLVFTEEAAEQLAKNIVQLAKLPNFKKEILLTLDGGRTIKFSERDLKAEAMQSFTPVTEGWQRLLITEFKMRDGLSWTFNSFHPYLDLKLVENELAIQSNDLCNQGTSHKVINVLAGGLVELQDSETESIRTMAYCEETAIFTQALDEIRYMRLTHNEDGSLSGGLLYDSEMKESIVLKQPSSQT